MSFLGYLPDNYKTMGNEAAIFFHMPGYAGAPERFVFLGWTLIGAVSFRKADTMGIFLTMMYCMPHLFSIRWGRHPPFSPTPPCPG
jgi:hypothetical protein